MPSSISTVTASVNMRLRHVRNAGISKRCTRSRSLPVVVDGHQRFDSMSAASRALGVSMHTIARLMRCEDSSIVELNRDERYADVEWHELPLSQHTHPMQKRWLGFHADDGVIFKSANGRITRPTVVGGYQRTRLTHFVHASGVVKSGTLSVHDVVASMFHASEWCAGKTVDHIDRCRSNNAPSNLRWCTPREQNMNRGCMQKRNSPLRYAIPGEVWTTLQLSFLDDVAALLRDYEISNHGRFRRAGSDRIMVGYAEPHGYTRIKLNGKLYRVHRLMASVFERRLWQFLVESQGVALRDIHVDHRHGINNNYIDLDEVAKWEKNLPVWYSHITAVQTPDNLASRSQT